MMVQSTIVVKEATDKGKTIQIVDTNKLKYTLWKTKSTGGSSPAYENFQGSGGVGATLAINYDEKDDSFTNTDGKLVNYKKRTIYDLSTGEGAPMPASSPKPAPRAVSSPSEATVGRNFKQEGYEKCLWGYWLATGASSGKLLDQAEMSVVWDVFNQIEQDANKRFATGWDKAVKTFGTDTEEVPLPEETGENIPF